MGYITVETALDLKKEHVNAMTEHNLRFLSHLVPVNFVSFASSPAPGSYRKADAVASSPAPGSYRKANIVASSSCSEPSSIQKQKGATVSSLAREGKKSVSLGIGRGLTVTLGSETVQMSGAKRPPVPVLSTALLKKQKTSELIEQVKEQRELNKEEKKVRLRDTRRCIVPGCEGLETRFLKPHAFNSHIPGVFQETLPADSVEINESRLKALEQAARWLLRRPASLDDLLHFLRMQQFLPSDRSAVSAAQAADMTGFCRHVKVQPPEVYNLSTANFSGILVHWKVLLLIYATLNVEEREYWMSSFPEPQPEVQPVEPAVPVGPDAIDSHFHLDRSLDRLHLPADGGLSELIQAVHVNEEEQVNVVGAVANFCDPKTYPSGMRLLDLPDKVKVAVGFHPRHASKYGKGQLSNILKDLGVLLKNQAVTALGEIGFDRTEPVDDWPAQVNILEKVLPLLEDRHVLVFHCRGIPGDDGTEAYLQLLHFIRRQVRPSQRIHLHCFSGNCYVLQRWLDEFPRSYFGFTNLVQSFRRDQVLALKAVEEGRLLLESDAPYFPSMGTRLSSPGQLYTVAKEVARLRGLSVEYVLDLTLNNARHLYWELIYQCVLALVLWQPVIHAENVQITNVDIPEDRPVQTQVEHTVSPAQITETASTDQLTDTVILATSLTTSLSIDQSESNSIKDGTHSSTLVEPSFSEVQRTSQTEQAVVESVSQSAAADQSEVTFKSSSSETVTENKHSLGDSAPVTTPEEHLSSEKEDDNEVKVTVKVEEIEADDAAEETKSSVNITELNTQEKVREEEKEEVVTEPSVIVPYKDEVRVDGEQPVEVGGQPGVGGETGDVIKEEKPEEEGLTFNEWTQKVLAEAERGKQGGHEDIQNFQLPPVKQRKKKNYASHECGAKILASNPEASSPKSVLNSNRDEYMNNPCKAKKWFVIELCEPIQAHSVDIASLELFSSPPKKFRVFLSDRYPTKDWKVAGEFDLRDERTVQTLPIIDAHDYYAKFVRVELLEHFGDEHFCPLTIFRVLGIAVIDYEDDHHDNIDDENDDENDENHEGETEEGSKNLFTSAKDTVINIVKKVLNVESEGERLIQNASQVNIPVDTNGTSVNVSASTEPEPTLPCVPDANIVTDKEDSCTGNKDEGHTEDILPHPVEPGKTDSVLVVKLEDHEQVETTPDITQRKSFDAHIQDCFLTVSAVTELKKRLSIVHSNLCEFLYMIKQQSPVQGYYERSVKKKKVAGKIVGGVDGRIKASEQVSDTTVAVDKIPIAQTDTVSEEIDNDSKTFASSVTKVLQDNHISESKILSEFSSGQEKSKSETADISKTTSKFIQPTSAKSTFASAGTQVVSSTQTVDLGSGKQTGSATSSNFEQSKTADSQKIEPSPTATELTREVTAETTREATPVLPDDWKPDTKDLLQEKTSVQTQKPSEAATKQTMKPDPSSANIPTGEATVSVPPSDLPQQVETADVAMNGASLDDITDELGSLDGETGEEIQDQRPNTTVIDEKVVVGNGGQQKRENLSLVRLPVIPSGKRESAIMRLSNRIKVLEQNVSLSSRFLEELSRRYKKQSEDMMKMLNKTMATLHNMTVEAEVKNKIHEDEMTAMERRLENLTHIVHKLTQNFDNLNRQVTDRQLIWTTIEIVIMIIFMLLFLHFRRKKVALPPEVKSLIESMPSKPAVSLPQRRNSLSGPATPSKERTFGNLQSGGGLQRFSSETALDSDFPIVHPIDGSLKQGLEAVKKKKKKKHKNLDIKLSLPNVSGPARLDNWPAQFSSQQSINNSNQSKETSPQPYNKSNLFLGTSHPPENRGNQSKEKGLHASCSLPQTQSGCFGSLLSGWSNNTATKQRSASLGTDISSTTFSTQVAGSFHPCVLEGTKDSLGTKNGTKGLAKKPPVSGGTSKVSPKLNTKTPKGSENEGSSKRLETTLEEKWIRKGHRRQKSLPKQHFSSVETVGNTSHDHFNPVGILGTVRHSDTTPFLNKISKKGEMKKSVSLPVSSEITFEKAPASIYTCANGHSESSWETFDTGQARNSYPLEKSKSDIYIASKYGKNMYKNEYLSNGHTNGDDCNETACSINQSATVSCSKAKKARTVLEPWAVGSTDSVKSGQNGTWKNIFGYFK